MHGGVNIRGARAGDIASGLGNNCTTLHQRGSCHRQVHTPGHPGSSPLCHPSSTWVVQGSVASRAALLATRFWTRACRYSSRAWDSESRPCCSATWWWSGAGQVAQHRSIRCQAALLLHHKAKHPFPARLSCPARHSTQTKHTARIPVLPRFPCTLAHQKHHLPDSP